jgi:uncharacterized protein YjiS (DUF1127 family)
MTQLTQSFSLLADVPSRIAILFEELIVEYKKARAASKTIKELQKLSNAELRDIGITRGEIHDVAMEAYYDNRENF